MTKTDYFETWKKSYIDCMDSQGYEGEKVFKKNYKNMKNFYSLWDWTKDTFKNATECDVKDSGHICALDDIDGMEN